MRLDDFMVFVVSCDDYKYEKFLERFPLKEINVHRVNITPETNKIEQPEWFRGGKDRWALQCAWITCLNLAKSAGKCAWMMEDDCIFIDNFKERLDNFLGALPEDWDSAYLGGQLIGQFCYPYKKVDNNPFVFEAPMVHRCHSWMVRDGVSTERVIAKLNDKNHTGDCVCDWFLVYLHRKNDFKVYIPAEGWLCGQGCIPSQLMRADQPERWWHFLPELAKQEVKDQENWNREHYKIETKQ